jgi:hypothetical protein
MEFADTTLGISEQHLFVCQHTGMVGHIFESGVKHLTSNGQMMDQKFLYLAHNIKHQDRCDELSDRIFI